MTNTAPLSADSLLRVSPSVYVRPFGEELVLLDFARGEYFGLDAIGGEVWRAVEAGQALGAVARTIAERYEVTDDVALRDVITLATHLRDEALVL